VGDYKGYVKEEGAVSAKRVDKGRLDCVRVRANRSVWKDRGRRATAKGCWSFKVLGGCQGRGCRDQSKLVSSTSAGQAPRTRLLCITAGLRAVE
jgi:hypothetical protein